MMFQVSSGIKKVMLIILAVVLLVSFVPLTGGGVYAKSSPKGTKITKLTQSKDEVTVRWKKRTKNAEGYQIQYSTGKKFKNGQKIKVQGSGNTVLHVKNLKKGKKYYFRIRTFQTTAKKIRYSKWSKKKSIHVASVGNGYASVLSEYRTFLKKVDAGKVNSNNVDKYKKKYIYHEIAYCAVGMNGFVKSRPEYSLADIDGNGVKELVIGGKDYDGNKTVGSIFTLDNFNNPVKLINCRSYTYRGRLDVYANGTIEFFGNGGVNDNVFTFYKIDGKKKKLKKAVELLEERGKYSVNGKVISKSDYNKKVSELENQKKWNFVWEAF